jgi:undecaprenyl pyrophosphate phosphatase UppP
MIRNILSSGVILLGLPGALLCGLAVSRSTDSWLLRALGIILPTFVVMGILVVLGRWARSDTAQSTEAVQPDDATDRATPDR